VSCTGKGEDFIRHAVAFHISALMTYAHTSIQDAVNLVISDKQHPIEGGIIAVSRDGTITMQFNTPGMSRGAADSAGRFDVALGR
jgi:beta-aspartyl-peptidase (threonine type)